MTIKKKENKTTGRKHKTYNGEPRRREEDKTIVTQKRKTARIEKKGKKRRR